MARVVVGRILKPFGVRGEVVIAATGEDPGRFARGESLFVEPVGEEALQIRLSRLRGDQITVSFEGVEDRDTAEELVGTVLYQDEEKLPVLPEGSYYHFQLVGLVVRKRDGEVLGTVVRVHELPTADVFEVRSEDHEWMVPRSDQFVERIDLAKGEIRLKAVDDLLDAVAQARVKKESPGQIRRRARFEARRRAWERREEKKKQE